MSTTFTPEEIIESLDGVQRAEPKPFLYTRISARIAKEESTGFSLILKVISAPAFSLGIAVLIVLINGYFMMKSTDSTIDTSDLSQGIAAEYNQHSLDPYEIPK
jgi:hypothetical protein